MKFPNLPASSALTGAEIVPLTQSSVDKRTTVQAIADANESKSANIASAATTDLSTATAAFVHVTGTTTITALGTVQAGTRRVIVFDGALTLTHNATSLILPTGANITTAAGDVAVLVSEGSGNWRCAGYTRANGTPLAQASSPPPSVQSVVSSATVTPTFSDDMVKITAQATGLTLANPTGTAVPAWGIAIRIKDNGTARSIAYGTQYRAIGVTLPTTTVISKTLYLGMVYNSDDTKWDVVAVAQEA
jgi:murein DD-endopeptidase MepM/ murein hydrolase activator NlpD